MKAVLCSSIATLCVSITQTSNDWINKLTPERDAEQQTFKTYDDELAKIGRIKKRKRADQEDEDEETTKKRKTLQGKVRAYKEKVANLTGVIETHKVAIEEHKTAFTTAHFKRANAKGPNTKVWKI